MSVSYLIAFDFDKALQKKEYLYKDILKSKKTVWGKDDCIIFTDELYAQEEDIAKNLFQQRKVYSIRSSVPLEYHLKDKDAICDEYYTCEKEQIEWLFEFLKKKISRTEDVLFVKIWLGHPINYFKILSEQYDVNDFVLPKDEFSFESHIYQFVNNK